MGAILSALLSSLGVKDYVYGALIALLLAGGVYYTEHERGVGEQKIETADAKVATAAKQHNADVQALAASQSAQLGEVYVQAVKLGPVSSPHVVCNLAPASGAVSAGTSDTGSAHASTSVPAASSVDIGAPLDAVGFDADQQVKALQAEVQALVAEMNAK